MILELFGGIGGWVTALPPGADHVSIELNDLAAASSRRADHSVLNADVTTLDPATFPGVTGITASPPCQSWSISGTGEGRESRERVLSAIRGRRPALDTRTRLTIEPLRWIRTLRPSWVCLEQVPPVLPVWAAYADRLESWGYHSAVGIIDAADHGVPQSRRRAVLIASRVGSVALPQPTSRISMSAALGLTDGRIMRSNYSGHTPGATTAAERGRTMRTLDQPSVTLTRRAPSWVHPDGSREPITITESLILQGFPHDYPLHGTISDRRLQVGNSIPPPLASALINAARQPVGPMPRPDTITVGVHIPRDLHKRLKLAAAHRETTIQAVVLEALDKAKI